MKKSLLVAAAWAALVILAALPLVGCGGNSSSSERLDAAGITASAQEWAKAINAKDAALLAAQYSEEYLDWGATKADIVRFWEEVFADPHVEVRVRHLGTYGLTPVAEGVVSSLDEWEYEYIFHDSAPAGGGDDKFVFAERLIRRREGGRWLLYGNQIVPKEGMIRDPADRTLREEIQRHIR